MLLGVELDDAPTLIPTLKPESDAAKRVALLLQMLRESTGGPAVLQSMREQWFLLELLAAWPHSHSMYLSGRTSVLPRAVARARDYIEANLTEPISVTDVAAAAHLGTRALSAAFAKHFGKTPVHYLRDRRLDAARHDLRSRSSRTVAEVSIRWQFNNPGLFAKYFRERFGYLPRAEIAFN